MKFHKILSTWAAGFGALSLLFGAFATQALAQDDEEIEEIVVEGSLRSLPTQDVGSVFGFDKSVLETPRSISTISSEQIERFGIANVDDFVALAPGTFTQSFFGTNGLDVRGTAGETYLFAARQARPISAVYAGSTIRATTQRRLARAIASISYADPHRRFMVRQKSAVI